MTNGTTLDLPALRWSESRGYGLDDRRVQEALSRGVPGFIVFGGTTEAARAAVLELDARAGRRLLFGADLERGAGQQFAGATPLPPLGALGAIDDPEVVRAAGAMTGREAVALGIPWVFAPVADLAVEAKNPIVGTRSFGADPVRVGRLVAAWIEGCRSTGAIPCVKHFPGHGRTLTDSHAGLPVVEADRETLVTTDLHPFVSAVQAGVPSVMTAHVAYPALDASGRPATRSAAIVNGLLRGELGFRGTVVSDALIMEGAGEPEAAVVEAVGAGVDLLLYPPEGVDVTALLRDGVERGLLSSDRLARAGRSLEELVARLPDVAGEESRVAAVGWGSREDREAAESWALGSLRATGRPPGMTDVLALTVVDDDQGGPYPPPSRAAFPEALRRAGREVVLEEGETNESPPAGGRGAVLAVYAEPRAWKGRSGLSPVSRERIARWFRANPDPSRSLVVLFGGSGLLAELPAGSPALLAWGGEPLMQEAAARWIRTRGKGR